MPRWSFVAVLDQTNPWSPQAEQRGLHVAIAIPVNRTTSLLALKTSGQDPEMDLAVSSGATISAACGCTLATRCERFVSTRARAAYWDGGRSY